MSVVVGATEIVAAMCADELAVVAGEAMAACGADLAVVIYEQCRVDWAGGAWPGGVGQAAPLCEISSGGSAAKSDFRARGSSGSMPDRLAWN